MKNFVKKDVIVARDSRAVECYMRDVAKFPLLTPAEEAELAVRSKDGDLDARTKLINSNLRFVLTVAHAYQGHGMLLEDLISEGNMGLQKAAELFDPTRGFRFCSYAVWWIRQSICQALAQNSRMVRLPSNRQLQLNRVNKAQSKLMQTLGRIPTSEEIADYLDEEVEQVEAINMYAAGTVSMDQTASDDNGSPLSERLASDASSPDSSLMQESLGDELEDAMSCLADLQKEILMKLYGFGGRAEASIGEIAMTLNISKERIRQLHRNALMRMRQSTKANSLRSYL